MRSKYVSMQRHSENAAADSSSAGTWPHLIAGLSDATSSRTRPAWSERCLEARELTGRSGEPWGDVVRVVADGDDLGSTFITRWFRLRSGAITECPFDKVWPLASSLFLAPAKGISPERLEHGRLADVVLADDQVDWKELKCELINSSECLDSESHRTHPGFRTRNGRIWQTTRCSSGHARRSSVEEKA